MPHMDSATAIEHQCRNLTTFTSDRADLRNGVTYTTSSFSEESGVKADFFEFGMWFAREIHPRLNGFKGSDSVNFTEHT